MSEQRGSDPRDEMRRAAKRFLEGATDVMQLHLHDYRLRSGPTRLIVAFDLYDAEIARLREALAAETEARRIYRLEAADLRKRLFAPEAAS